MALRTVIDNNGVNIKPFGHFIRCGQDVHNVRSPLVTNIHYVIFSFCLIFVHSIVNLVTNDVIQRFYQRKRGALRRVPLYATKSDGLAAPHFRSPIAKG